MTVRNHEDVDFEEIVLKVEDSYGEEVAQKFSDLADLNPDDAYKYLGRLFCGLIPQDEDEDFELGEDDE